MSNRAISFLMMFFVGFMVSGALQRMGRQGSSLVFAIIAIGAMCFFIAEMRRMSPRQGLGRIKCPNCQFTGQGALRIKGNGWVEVALYLAFFIPGIVYSIWRRAGLRPSCPQCGYIYVVISPAPLMRRVG